ncbi:MULTISPECIES: hypothetical protein [unclassified Ensifer]|uniref:hypothetical protein n=1 Tax=unclassified Ensifer TaxID=2633371 RepID=UPI00300FD9F2
MTRSVAAAKLWPDVADEAGRANLRRALWHLPHGWIGVDGDELVLQATSDFTRAREVAARALGGEPRTFDEIGLISHDILPGWHEEVATDASLFSEGDGPEDEFYATWQDQPLLTGSSYTLSYEAWQRLNYAENLYYRVGTTISETGWENYMVSTDGSDWPTAPSIRIEVGRSLAQRRSASKGAMAY